MYACLRLVRLEPGLRGRALHPHLKHRRPLAGSQLSQRVQVDNVAPCLISYPPPENNQTVEDSLFNKIPDKSLDPYYDYIGSSSIAVLVVLVVEASALRRL